MISESPTRERIRREPTMRSLRVAHVADLPNNFRRLTVVGDELESFEATGPADHVKVMIHADTPDAAGRHYTPRELRETDGGRELDIDFLCHGDGPLAEWAAAAEEGEAVRIGGPRSSTLFPTNVRNVVVGGDAAALPAIARWIEDAARADIPVTVLLHGEGREYLEANCDIATVADVHEVAWDDSGESLVEAARGISDLFDAGTYAWFGGESTTLIGLRRWIRDESGVARGAFKVDGYWQVGVADRDHHAPVDPNDTGE